MLIKYANIYVALVKGNCRLLAIILLPTYNNKILYKMLYNEKTFHSTKI